MKSKIILGAALGVIVGALWVGGIYEEQNSKTVMDICGYSHGIVSGDVERICGSIQERTGYEYLCKRGECHTEKNVELGRGYN